MMDIVGSGRPLKELDVARLERDLGVKLPKQYRAFLLAHNGGAPNSKTQVVATTGRGLSDVVYGPPNAKPRVDELFGDNVQISPAGSLLGALKIDQGPEGSLTIGRTVTMPLRIAFRGKNAGSVFVFDQRTAGREGFKPKHMRLVASSFDELIERTAPELTDSAPVPTNEDVAKFEKDASKIADTKITLPKPYVAFLQKTNGGFVKRANVLRAKPEEEEWADALERFHTMGSSGRPKGPPDLRAQARNYEGRVPPDTLPIGNDEAGNLILLGVAGKNAGKVFFWSHHEEAGTPLGRGTKPTYDNVTLVANTFDEFLEGLQPEEP